MKIDLDLEQLKDLHDQVQDNLVHKYFQQRKTVKFEIGDVLLKLCKKYKHESSEKEEWTPENINSQNKMSQRYVYVFEDEFGIGYIKALKVSDGSLSNDTLCLTEFDYDSVRFEVDPEYAINNLLGGDFDIKKLHKQSLEASKMIVKMNRKIGIKPYKISEMNLFFETLKCGDKFWVSRDFTAKRTYEYEFTSLKRYKINDYQLEIKHYAWKSFKLNNKDRVDSEYVYEINYKAPWGDAVGIVNELCNYMVLFKTKPAAEEKNK